MRERKKTNVLKNENAREKVANEEFSLRIKLHGIMNDAFSPPFDKEKKRYFL